MFSISRKKQVKNRPYLHLEEEIPLAHAFLDTWHQMRRLLRLHLLLLTLFYLYHDHAQVQHDHAPPCLCSWYAVVLIWMSESSNSLSGLSEAIACQFRVHLRYRKCRYSSKNLAASSAVYLLDAILTHTTTFYLQNAKIHWKNDPKLVEKFLRTLC